MAAANYYAQSDVAERLWRLEDAIIRLPALVLRLLESLGHDLAVEAVAFVLRIDPADVLPIEREAADNALFGYRHIGLQGRITSVGDVFILHPSADA